MLLFTSDPENPTLLGSKGWHRSFYTGWWCLSLIGGCWVLLAKATKKPGKSASENQHVPEQWSSVHKGC